MTRSTVPVLLRSGLVLGMLAALPGGAGAQPKDAAPATRDANAAVLQQLPFADREDFADARRGFVAALPDGVRLNGARAEGKHIVLNWTFTDLGETHVLNLENSALTHRLGPPSAQADASLTLTRATLDAIVLKQLSFPDAVKSGQVAIAGNAAKPAELLGLLDEFSPSFAVVTPREPP